MWPFSTIRKLRSDLGFWKRSHDLVERNFADIWTIELDQRKEIADLKASNERLADALAAAKERAGDA